MANDDDTVIDRAPRIKPSDSVTDTVIQPSAYDAYGLLTIKLGHLEAMLTMSYGDALESIDEMNDNLRQHYYWACADLAEDCSRLLTAIPCPAAEVSHG